jgi:hypothetical protein
MAESFERPSKEWNGVPGTRQELNDLRRELAAGVERAHWGGYFCTREGNPRQVNLAYRDRGSWSTLLHEAVRLNAPLEFVRELVRLGAFRTVKDSQGFRPVDLTLKKGLVHLVEPLEPGPGQPVNANGLEHMQELFHGLIRSTMLTYNVSETLWLPQLSILAEPGAESIWFPIPGMYGGFHFWLEATGGATALIAESWCRVADGSGMRHRITPVQVVLEEEGFV